MIRFLLILVTGILLLSCHEQKRAEGPQQIALLPFSGADPVLVGEIKKGLEERVHGEIIILDAASLPASAYYNPRRRYVADSLLDFLNDYNKGRFDVVLGITTRDISTTSDPRGNRGIMGQGYCPGRACVISSFRVKRTSRDDRHFAKRMQALALHELGHTWSLSHCKKPPCIMEDAEGKMKLDKADYYCDRCSFYLKSRGILK